MSRLAKIFSHVDRSGKGLEIGAGYNPAAPRKSGFNVDVLDHMSKEELICKYREQESGKYQGYHFPVENIQDVDYVWKGEPYAELIGKTNVYDWIIASHVIEHAPDFIGFLNDCASVLKTTGVLSLAVPDVRYHFDYFRPITGIGKIIDAHVQRNHIHTEGSVAEFFLNLTAKGGEIAWGPGFQGELSLLHTVSDALENMDVVRNKKIYIDVHVWEFTPSSFRLLIHDLHSLGLIPFQEVCFYTTTEGCEFHVTLGRPAIPPAINRLELLKQVQNEISEVADNVQLLETQLRSLKATSAVYKADLESTRSRLAEIYGSRGWRLLSHYYKWRHRIVASGHRLARAGSACRRLIGNKLLSGKRA